MKIFKLPDLGEGLQEAEIVEWHVKAGDEIAADQPLVSVETAKAIGWKAPVKVLWTREDDMRGGRYRPLFVHKVKVALDADGQIIGWHHRQVGQSILIGTPFEGMMVKDGVDATSAATRSSRA